MEHIRVDNLIRHQEHFLLSAQQYEGEHQNIPYLIPKFQLALGFTLFPEFN